MIASLQRTKVCKALNGNAMETEQVCKLSERTETGKLALCVFYGVDWC